MGCSAGAVGHGLAYYLPPHSRVPAGPSTAEEGEAVGDIFVKVLK